MTAKQSRVPISGFEAQEQVALALKVPTSGTEWIDEMILVSLRLDFMKEQYKGVSTNPSPGDHLLLSPEQFINEGLGVNDEEE